MTTDLQPGDLRASDEERERVASTLREHAGHGRLEVAELEERLERAYSARTRSELVGLTRDLPALLSSPQAPAARSGQRRELRDHVIAFVLVNILLIGIWAASGADYFWPIWPLLGWGIGVASHASETLRGRPLSFGRGCGRRRSAASR